jgi:Rieske Fe-S protein
MSAPSEPRRNFIKGLLTVFSAGLLGTIVYPVIRFISPPKVPEASTNRVKAGTVQELEKKGWKVFPFGSTPAIIIRTDEGELRAFSALCTHLDCTVQYRKDLRRIWCPCHNGFYDLNGINVAGPPPRPLTKYVVNVQGDDIFVSRA